MVVHGGTVSNPNLDPDVVEENVSRMSHERSVEMDIRGNSLDGPNVMETDTLGMALGCPDVVETDIVSMSLASPNVVEMDILGTAPD